MNIILKLNALVLLLFPAKCICSKFDYLLFENFELTKQTFLEEQIVLKNIKNIGNVLRTIYSDLDLKVNRTSEPMYNLVSQYEQSILRDKSTFIQQMTELSKRLHEIRTSYKEYFQTYLFGFEKVYGDITRIDILIAAQKGMIMLQDTYNLDLKLFSKGNLNLKNNQLVKSRSVDSLQVEDLISMSGVAFNEFQWYDASIRYLKQATDNFFSTSRNAYQSSLFKEFLQECLALMTKWYPSYHNDMITKTNTSVGPDWKAFPLIVNEGTRYVVYK